MKNGFSIAVASVVLGLSGQSPAQQPDDVETIPAAGVAAAERRVEGHDLEAWLDGFMSAALEPAKIAGAVVSVVEDGGRVFSKGYGYADYAAMEPMDPGRTLVRVGSTSKLFTWTAVMQLVEQGKLDLNEDVNVYLDFEIPDRPGKAVTMHDLMTHRGGFEEGLREILVTDPDQFISTEDYLKAHPRPRIFPAGEVPAYSNYGTALAGYIVERITGESFDDYIDRHILVPLEMRRTTFRQPLPFELQADMSAGYMSSDEAPWAFELVTAAPAGALTATADDMANFMIAHLQRGRFGGEKILESETARSMYSPSVEQPPGFATMAHGFFSGSENGRWVIGHGGDTILFHTDMNLVPDEGVGFFVSFNSRGADNAVYEIRQRLFSEFMDRYFPDTDAPQDAPAIADAAAHAEEVARSYQSSRRIETAFLGSLYLLQQNKVTANADGTISLASDSDRKFRETAPGIWREEGGDDALHITQVDGRITISSSDNPTSVLQAVSMPRNATLNTIVLFGSLLLLLLMLVAWPVGWWYRRKYAQRQLPTGSSLLAWRLTRVAALADFVYLYGWYLALQPLIENRLDEYGPSLDGLLVTLQAGSVVPIAGAFVGLWNAWLSIRSDRHWTVKTGNLLIAAALVGIVWIAWLGRLIGFNLEY